MRIAHCRNTLLNAARTEFELSKSQYFFVCDPSQASDLSVFTRENFLSNFMYDRNEWAAFTATQTYDYYDIWPLRSKLVNHDALDMVNRYKANWTFWPAWDNFVTPYKRPIPLDYPHLIEVNSAFGGAAIYQSKYLKSCNYSGWLVDKEVSEHVPFHECIKNISGGGARIFINPKFQTATDWKD
ncbi:unnamed protein product [Didymodactylos carnosus]|nr:unnamed protein product [Didymodactylos carnosus]CAF4363716.1 unnamed protein product [Didymodactylos carnosus]